MQKDKRKEIEDFVADWMAMNKYNAVFDMPDGRCMVKINDRYPVERWNIQFLFESIIIAYMDRKDKEWLSIRTKE